MEIRLKSDPTVEGYEGAFYRFHTENGTLSPCGIWDNWYSAEATDESGNEYRVVWTISDHEAFNNGDEDCCDWDNPAEIYSYSEGKTVTATIVW